MTFGQRSGFGYFLSGIQLAVTPGIRRFVLFPLLTNLILIGGALYYVFSNLQPWINHWMSYLPSFLSWLSYVLWPILVFCILFVSMYFFTTIANIIASPFNGLLAEKVEIYLDGQSLPEESLFAFIKDIPRMMGREFRKIRYSLPKTIGLFILLLIPGLGQTIGPIAWFVFSAWMLAIQYCDYAFDNHKMGFQEMRLQLKQKQGKAYGFGILVAFFTTVPLLNLFVMPVAVCGATAMWVYEFKAQSKSSHRPT